MCRKAEMWRYQTDEASGREQLWQVDSQPHCAGMNGVSMDSPLMTSSAWMSANAVCKPSDAEPLTAGPQSFGGYWRTQPCHSRWQCSSPMSICQPTASPSRYCTASAPARYSTAAQAGLTQHPLVDAQWESPSNYRVASQCYTFPHQPQPIPCQLTFDSELTAALSFAGAAGRFPISCW